MKYNGFYFWMFKGSMKKVLAEKYGKAYAAEVMKKSKAVYRELVEQADDIGHDNPMAYNELFALAFVAPYVASGKKIPPETVQEMMRRALYHIKWYFGRTDLNTDKGKVENKKSIVRYIKWYTPEKERQYPDSFKVDFVGQPYEGACYYRITRCPICAYAEKLGVLELMPLFCQLDEVMITLQHGVLHRRQTLAGGGAYCDYFITGDKERAGAARPAAPVEEVYAMEIKILEQDYTVCQVRSNSCTRSGIHPNTRRHSARYSCSVQLGCAVI